MKLIPSIFHVISAGLVFSSTAYANEELKETARMERGVRDAVTGESPDSSVRLTLPEVASTYGDDAAPILEALLKDERPEIRSRARSGLAEVGTRSSDPRLRQELLEKILESALAERTVDSNLQSLYGFRNSEANARSRQLLLNRLGESLRGKEVLRYEPGVLLVIGALPLKEAQPALHILRAFEHSRTGKRPIVDSCAMLALARMGDPEAIRECKNEHKSIEDGEKRALLLGNLSYVRRPEMVEYLKEYLFSDEVYPTASDDNRRVSDQWYAYLALQSMIVIPDGIGYPEFRTWMTTQKTFSFKD